MEDNVSPDASFLSSPARRVLLLILLIQSCFVFAQSEKLDSLLDLVANGQIHDTIRVNAGLQAADLLNIQFDSTSLELSEEALEMARKSNYLKGEAYALSAIGSYYRFQKVDFDMAQEYYKKAEAAFERLHDANGYGTVCIHLGVLYELKGRLHSALEYYLKANKLLESEGNYKNSGLGFELIAGLYMKRGNYDKAETYFKKAIQKYTENDRQALLQGVTLSLAWLYINWDRLEEARKKIGEATRIADLKGYTHIYKLQIEAKMLHKETKCNLAILKLDTAFQVAKIYHAKVPLELYLERASCYIHTGNFQKSQSILDEARNLPSDFQVPHAKSEMIRVQAEIEEGLGNIAGALKSYKLYYHKSDSVLAAHSRLNLEDVELKYEAEKKDKESSLLKMQLDVKGVQVRNLYLLVAFGTAVIVLTVIIAVILFASRSRIRKKNLLLNEQNKEIQSQYEEIIAQHEEINSQADQLKASNEFLALQNEKLEEVNIEKDGLMSIVAHDLRAPLNRTKGLASLLRIRTYLHAEDLKVVDKIIRVSEEGITLIREILEINAQKHEASQPIYYTINLEKYVHEEIVKQFEDSARKKMIQIVNAMDSDIEMIVDHASVKRVLENLVSNAIKFSPPQTRITIRASQSANDVFIGIQDEGPGISHEDQKKMFRKFQRLTARPTGGEYSTGLGLSIVKSLVDKMNGEITIESDLDAGTEFIVKLPKKIMIPSLKLSQAS